MYHSEIEESIDLLKVKYSGQVDAEQTLMGSFRICIFDPTP